MMRIENHNFDGGIGPIILRFLRSDLRKQTKPRGTSALWFDSNGLKAAGVKAPSDIHTSRSALDIDSNIRFLHLHSHHRVHTFFFKSITSWHGDTPQITALFSVFLLAGIIAFVVRF